MPMKAGRGLAIAGPLLLAAAFPASRSGGGRANAAEPLWRVQAAGEVLACSADHKTLLVAGATTEAVCVDGDGGVRWRFSDGSGEMLLTGDQCLTADGAFAVVGGISQDPASGEFVPTFYVLDAAGKPVSHIRRPGRYARPSISKDGRLVLAARSPQPRWHPCAVDGAGEGEEIELYRRDGTPLWTWPDVEPAPGEHEGWQAVLAGPGDGVIAWADDGTITFTDPRGKRWWQIVTGWEADPDARSEIRLSSDGDAFVFYRNGTLSIPKVERLDSMLTRYGHDYPIWDAAECPLSSLLAYQLKPASLADVEKVDLSYLLQEHLALTSEQGATFGAGIEAAGGMHVVYVQRREGIELIRIGPDRELERTLLPGTAGDYGRPPVGLSEDGRYLAVGVVTTSETADIPDAKILIFDNAGRLIRAIRLRGDKMPIGPLVVSGALRRIFFLEQSMDASGLVCYGFPQ